MVSGASVSCELFGVNSIDSTQKQQSRPRPEIFSMLRQQIITSKIQKLESDNHGSKSDSYIEREFQ